MFTLVSVLLPAGCAPGLAVHDSTRDSPNLQLIARYISAWNRQDVDLLLSFMHDDVEWLSVADNELRQEIRGVHALKAALSRSFGSVPGTRSTIESAMVAGRFVTVLERAHWQGPAGARSQSALAIYEIDDGRIRRVWYYPAQPDPPLDTAPVPAAGAVQES